MAATGALEQRNDSNPTKKRLKFEKYFLSTMLPNYCEENNIT